MNETPKRDRIPLPPVLLSVVPFLGMPLGVLIAWAVFPFSRVSLLLGGALGFALPLFWIAKRVRG